MIRLIMAEPGDPLVGREATLLADGRREEKASNAVD